MLNGKVFVEAIESLGHGSLKKRLSIVSKAYEITLASTAEPVDRRSTALLMRVAASDRSPTIRCMAIEVLGLVGTRRDSTLARLLLNDKDALVRCAAVVAFAQLQGPACIKNVWRVFHEDRSRLVRAHALIALEEVLADVDLSDLESAAIDRDTYVAIQAGYLLLLRGDSGPWLSLLQRIDPMDWLVTNAVIELTNTDDFSAAPKSVKRATRGWADMALSTRGLPAPTRARLRDYLAAEVERPG